MKKRDKKQRERLAAAEQYRQLRDAAELYRDNYLGSTEDLIDYAMRAFTVGEMRGFMVGLAGWMGGSVLSAADRMGCSTDEALDRLIAALAEDERRELEGTAA